MSALCIFPSPIHSSAPLQKKKKKKEERGGGETEGWVDRREGGREGVEVSGVVGFMDGGMLGGGGWRGGLNT